MGRRVWPGRDWRRWARLRRVVFERDGWRCRTCGKAGRLEADHVVPISKGGDPWDMANLQTLCRGCHIEKHRPRIDPERQRWLNRLRESG